MRQVGTAFERLWEETTDSHWNSEWDQYGMCSVEVTMAIDASLTEELLRDLVRPDGDDRYVLETLPFVMAMLVNNEDVNRSLLAKVLSDVA